MKVKGKEDFNALVGDGLNELYQIIMGAETVTAVSTLGHYPVQSDDLRL